jgi:AcrR family transcriptional regulator
MPKVTEEHRTARREQILDAAMRCVAREGFHRTTMAHVIAESGLSAGAVYGYFKGKPDLIRAIAGRALGGFSEVLQAVASGPGPVTPAAALRAMLLEVERIATESGGDFPRVAVHAWSEAARDTEVREIVRTNIGLVHAAWLEVLERAAADGTLPDGDRDAMARALIGLVPGFVLQGPLLGDVDAASYLAGYEALTGATEESPAIS